MMLFFAALILFIILSIKNHSQRYFESTAESSLTQVLDINELHTLEYRYNSYALVYEDSKIKYAVAYEGIITAGINQPVTFDIDRENKLITVTIPPAQIIDLYVNIPADMENKSVICTQRKYINSDSWHKEAFSACHADLQEKITTDMEFLTLATENARDAITALLRPFKTQCGYDFVVKIC